MIGTCTGVVAATSFTGADCNTVASGGASTKRGAAISVVEIANEAANGIRKRVALIGSLQQNTAGTAPGACSLPNARAGGGFGDVTGARRVTEWVLVRSKA
jgi:hypothetical protein